ncbi:HNH endonuclease protein [Rhizobium phage RHph_Y55]|nr:HNH endonuclease protein [Rhizobium phage RHph_Y55]
MRFCKHCEKPAKASKGLCWGHYWKLRTYGDPLVEFRTPNGEPLRWLTWAFERETDNCVLWPYATLDERGYGVSANRDSTGSMLVHRWICEKQHGICPPGFEAAHSCGNGGCCNKRHLIWKPHFLNEADKLIHGTACRNSFSEEDIFEIRRLASTGLLQKDIAGIFDTRQGVISKIVNFKIRRA